MHFSTHQDQVWSERHGLELEYRSYRRYIESPEIAILIKAGKAYSELALKLAKALDRKLPYTVSFYGEGRFSYQSTKRKRRRSEELVQGRIEAAKRT